MPRNEQEIIEDLRDVEAGLSPENLSCDGELSKAQTRRRHSALKAKEAALIAELGRTPDFKEIWGVD